MNETIISSGQNWGRIVVKLELAWSSVNCESREAFVVLDFFTIFVMIKFISMSAYFRCNRSNLA
uniref:Uncharacterized protein n=1 Tax=Strongyloides papillosus TaxID=174720 RepID=A0A0N5BDJ1_STREA